MLSLILIIILSYIAFVSGILVVYTAKGINGSTSNTEVKADFFILYNDGKNLKIIISHFIISQYIIPSNRLNISSSLMIVLKGLIPSSMKY